VVSTSESARRHAIVRWSRIVTVVVVGTLLIIGLLTEVKAYLYAMIVAAVVITVGVRYWLLLRDRTSGPARDENP
jgi:uncharacterized membrane protein YphA (DoxX/SURF4 family)